VQLKLHQAKVKTIPVDVFFKMRRLLCSQYSIKILPEKERLVRKLRIIIGEKNEIINTISLIDGGHWLLGDISYC